MAEFKKQEIETAAENAAKKLGYLRLKELQKEVIIAVVTGNDVFGVLPTGYGKSLIYGCLPLIYDTLYKPAHPSIVAVVTPLTAIIRDQVSSFSSRGLTSAGIMGNTPESVVAGVLAGNYQLLFFTPEAILGQRRWRNFFREECVGRMKVFVIDEAHTVKMWGATFRIALSRIGEVRSILPEGTHCIALTATATRLLRSKVSDIIGIQNPTVIAVSPCKRNLMYTVTKFISIKETFGPLLQRLKRLRVSFPRVIIYCQRYEDSSNLYIFFKNGLAGKFTEPCDAPDQSRFRLVEMFTSCTDEEVKQQIIQSFTSQTPLRIVCATVAFGMGLDCTDVRQVIHLGAPDDVESYIQETGRGGRDGSLSMVSLLTVNRNNQFRDKNMLGYQKNDSVCRRDLLFQDMDAYEHLDMGTKCVCCDICLQKCVCGACESKHQGFLSL